MKIIPVSYANPILRQHKQINNNNKQNVENPINVKNPYSENYINYMIPFKAKNFEQTVQEDYFKLPKDCTPDKFQYNAGKILNNNHNVIVEAPTGMGKTAIAYYVASKNMEEGKKTFYTTPLIALSNQKVDEFKKKFSQENVGIMTGEKRENVNAPIVIMTTEVYRNMALNNMYSEKNNPLMDNLGTVIFDELHYMDDLDRGTVWEEGIMYTPSPVQILALSATIGNSNSVLNWFSNLKDKKTELVSVSESERYVPLVFDKLYTESYKKEAKREKNIQNKINYNNKTYINRPEYEDYRSAVNKLNKEKKLPAIFFVFSKKFSREILNFLEIEGKDLTTPAEKEEIRKIVNEYRNKNYLGYDLNLDALEKGYAVHNAGIIPEQKELIEELFQKKLVKVVLATETLAAGINMPAKTVVISRPYKPAGNRQKDSIDGLRMLTPNEFKQMSGRAGRRGIDEVGFVYTLCADKKSENDFMILEQSSCNPIRSKFNPDYAFLTRYVENNPNKDYLSNLYNQSFFVNAEPSNEKNRLSILLDLSERRLNVLAKRGFIESDGQDLKLTSKGYMSEQIKGYDNLTIVEAIKEGKFKGMTPETIAAIAGMLANSGDYHEEDIAFIRTINSLFGDTEESLNTLYDNLQKSIVTGLKKLGKEYSDFENLDEMLDFVKGIEVPEINKPEILSRINNLERILTKLRIINSSAGDYSVNKIYNAMECGDNIPQEALHKAFENMEKYKKKNNITNFDLTIKNLESRIQKLDENMTSTSKKALKRYQTEKDSLLSECEYVKILKYFDENLPEEINRNYEYSKKYNMTEIQKEYRKLKNVYSKNELKAELINQINGIKDIGDWIYLNDFDKLIQKNESSISGFIQYLKEKRSNINETEKEEGLVSEPELYGINSLKVLYKWALLNKINSDGISNWNLLIKTNNTNFDEGGIYRKILQTSDLLGQMKDVVLAGKMSAQSEEEKEYYNELFNNINEAKKLILNNPVQI